MSTRQQPRQMRETFIPVDPNRAYSIVFSYEIVFRYPACVVSLYYVLLFSECARSTARKVTISQALRIPTSRSSSIAAPTIYNAEDGFFGSTNAAIISKTCARRGNAIYQSQSSNVD